jgi:hypothetical protein
MVETWIAAAAVGFKAGNEADRCVPLQYRSIYRPSQKLPFTTGGKGSIPEVRPRRAVSAGNLHRNDLP